jgi:hypothetical protein
MFRAFLDGIATMVGWRVGEAVVRGAKREIGRSARARSASAKASFEEQLAECARELPGGTAGTALVVTSSAQIEPRASALSCLVCDDGAMNVASHRAATVDGHAVRIIDLECRACGSPRVVHFRIDRARA